jgi:hypothetical protein
MLIDCRKLKCEECGLTLIPYAVDELAGTFKLRHRSGWKKAHDLVVRKKLEAKERANA